MTTRIFKTYLCNLTFIFISAIGIENSYSPVAQVHATAHYDKTDSVTRIQLAEKTTTSIKKIFVPPSHFNKKTKEDYLKNRDRIINEVSNEISHYAIPDALMWPLLQKVHNKIIEANPYIKNTRILLVADPSPNAYSIGDGTVVVHVGLLAGLESEDQLAFVICHELAHFILRHSSKGLENQVKELNSKVFKEKIKKLEAQQYNRNEQIGLMYRNILFNSRYHSRNHERESDSLAFHLYRNTQYQISESQRLMEIFSFIDDPFKDSVLHISSEFGCQNQPFQDDWLTSAGGSIWEKAHKAEMESNKEFRDSIGTHPDWKNRLDWLKSLTELYPHASLQKQEVSHDYSKIKFQSAIECVEAWYGLERYDRVLFLATHYQNLYHTCQYFQEVECLNLLQLYRFTKAHNVAKVLAQSDKKYSERYNHFLDFLNSLRLKEILGLAECSFNQLSPEKGEHGLLAAHLLAREKNDVANVRLHKQAYLKKFPNGRFRHLFNN
ncbi:MAG: M48 family metallopeptidase [Saprospiraceae bacterium]|nr:M48 family metallopeptidase [Saprospiraceae bacterium]